MLVSELAVVVGAGSCLVVVGRGVVGIIVIILVKVVMCGYV